MRNSLDFQSFVCLRLCLLCLSVGRDGSQIVPRWATNVYFNCVTGECLIMENEKIRRDVCGCTPVDPREPITPGVSRTTAVCSSCAAVVYSDRPYVA